MFVVEKLNFDSAMSFFYFFNKINLYNTVEIRYSKIIFPKVIKIISVN